MGQDILATSAAGAVTLMPIRGAAAIDYQTFAKTDWRRWPGGGNANVTTRASSPPKRAGRPGIAFALRLGGLLAVRHAPPRSLRTFQLAPRSARCSDT
jgi:hypothetical protein